MEIRELNYTIEGLTPLLMANPRSMMMRSQNNGGPKKQKAVPSPEDEAEMSVYRDADGLIGFPAIGVRNATITAAAAFKYKTRSWKGFVTHIQIEPNDLLMLSTPKGESITDYEIDMRRCVIRGARGAAIVRSRPLIRTWRTSFAFIVDTSMLPTDDPHGLIKTFLLEAGSRIGIGDYRPEKTGWFGRFTVLD